MNSEVRMRGAAALVMALVGVSVAYVEAQGLGDAAKQERKRRAKPVGNAPTRVYTSDDLRSAPRESGPGPASAAPQPPREAASGESATRSEQGEPYWRERIAQAQTTYDAARLRSEAAQNAWNEEGMKSHRGMVAERMDEPGCSEGMVNLGNGLARPCQEILVYDPDDRALFAELAAAHRSLEAAEKELAAAREGAMRAGIKL